MKFRGFTLAINYCPGSDTKELKSGKLAYCKPKKEDIDFISTENLDTGDRLPNSLTFKEAKDFIRMYEKIGIA